MLSIATLKSASQAANYYEKGDYYTQEEQAENSQWFGQGANALGLAGSVDKQVFKNLLAGKLPNGIEMYKGYNTKGEPLHRPGYDLTFSAAKSASILAMKDPRIIAAHNEAVKATLAYIEKDTAARVKKNGAIELQTTQKLTAATFLHKTSRALDPNLHTHCVILNMTEIAGQWRSLYGDDYYKTRNSLGLQYRLEFAQRLMQLGYELEQTSQAGFFEIKGVPEPVIKQFSKRRQEIEQVLQAQGLDGQQKLTIVLNKDTQFERSINTVASAMANYVTRARKYATNLNELKERWDAELTVAGFASDKLADLCKVAIERGPIKPLDPTAEIARAFPAAMLHLTEQKPVFAKRELFTAVKALCMTSFPTDTLIEKFICNAIEQKTLVSLEGGKLTTSFIINLEKTNIALMQAQQGQCWAILPIGAEWVAKFLLKEPSKREALQLLLANKDRFVAIDAQHEADQLKVLQAFRWSAVNTKNYLIGPNLKTAQNFAQAAGIKHAFSVKSFLEYTTHLVKDKTAGKLRSTQYKHIWFIQRSHRLSSKELAIFEQQAISLNARVVLLGDHLRSSGVNVRDSFRYLLENGIGQANLTASRNDALVLLREQKIQLAFSNLAENGALVAINDRHERLMAAVNFAVEQNGVVITQNNLDRLTVNMAVRQLKQASGELHGEIIKTNVLVPVYLSLPQKQNLASLQVGDVIRFNQTINNTCRLGKYATIVDLDVAQKALILTDHDTNFSLPLNRKAANALAVYRRQTREIQVGDVLSWQDSTPFKLQDHPELVNAAGKVVQIAAKQVTLVLPSGQICTLDLNQFKHQHLEHAYAQTLTACVKQNFVNGALLLNNTGPATNLSAVYTGLSAITGNKKIFCADLEQLKQSFIDHTGLDKYAHIQQSTKFKAEAKDELFANARGEIMGTLARHQAMLEKIVPEIKLKNTPLALPNTPEYGQAIVAVDYALAKLAEREAVFTNKELVDLAKSYDIKIAPENIEIAITQAIKEGWLINKAPDTLVTKEVYALESACLKIQKHGEGVMQPIIFGADPIIDLVKDHPMLTSAQKAAISLVISSEDRVNLVQGAAGVGKTTMLKEVKRICLDAGYELLGLANTASAKNNLTAKTAGEYQTTDGSTFFQAGITGKTLASFINQTEKMLAITPELAKLTYAKPMIFILDEASLVSVRDMFAFLNIVEQLDARAIIVGDDRQLPAIEASRAFQLLLGTGKSKTVMNINTRLQTKAALSLMQDVYAVKLDDAFDKLLANLVEIPDRNERLQAMANYYLQASKADRREIMPMLPLNQDRVDFNTLVRAGLKEEGTLTGTEKLFSILEPKDLTHPERKYALSFTAGNWVKFNQAVPRLGISKGEYLLVTGRKDDLVILINQDGHQAHWDPQRFAGFIKGAIEVYKESERGLMVGDVIRWRRNDESRGIINSETAQVINMHHQVQVKLTNGELLNLDLTKKANQHWDHAYGATVHVVQGLDKYNPIGQGLGAAPEVKELKTIKEAEVIMIPADQTNEKVSKVGKVIAVGVKDGNPCLTAIDRNDQQYQLSNKEIMVYPDFTQAKAPKISSLESFLVMATRGDKLVMFVDNIEGYKAALKDNQDLKQTALSIMLPELAASIKDTVKTMTSVVYGLAKPEELKPGKNPADSHIDITPSNAPVNNLALDKAVNKAPLLNFNESKQPKYDLAEIKQNLARNVLQYASRWKGEPNKKTSREARWGKQGSFSVVLSGPKVGTWADFEAGAAGKDLVSLYMHTFNRSNTDFPQVIQELAREVGISPMSKNKSKPVMNTKPDLLKEHVNQDRAKYISKVEKLYASASILNGTLGETYLREVRGIKGQLPDSFKFKARCWHDELKTYRPALIVPGVDRQGKLQAVNRIYLNQDGSKLNETFKAADGKLQLAMAKRNYGPTFATTIEVNKVKEARETLVSEGLENALSLQQAKPEMNIISAFGVGQLKNLTITPATQTIILCADNDGLATNTKGPMVEALQTWLAQGYQVKLAMPFGNKVGDKIDFNDLLKQQGTSTIAKCLNSAITITSRTEFFEKSVASLSQDFLRLQKIEQEKTAPVTMNVLAKNSTKIVDHELAR